MSPTPHEVGIAAEAALLLSGAALALRLAPGRLGGSLVRRACREDENFEDSISPEEVNAVTAAVQRAARRVPASCLAQALVAWWMLKRRAGRSVVRLGVGRPDGRVSAHAWLERRGRVLVGADGAATHVGFPPLQ